jgi:hypothetical protein
MCLLAVLWRMTPDAPLLVAANREEAYDRPSTPPHLVADPVPFIGGLDERAGGTWLGLNQHGLLVAVTNAEKTQPPPQPRSRGLLARQLLACSSASAAAKAAAAALASHHYDGCRLLVGDLTMLYVVQGTDLVQVHPLPPGLHVLVNRAGVNQPGEPRIAFTQAWIASQDCERGADWLVRLPGFLGWTGDEHLPPICLRGERRGTVSSTIIALRDPLRHSRYLHAAGPPDQTAFVDYSHLLGSW